MPHPSWLESVFPGSSFPGCSLWCCLSHVMSSWSNQIELAGNLTRAAGLKFTLKLQRRDEQ